ncbi:hypothetical protein [Mesorhizobium hawassense]|uniref:hypothetical protein n=1 Tax=Mesorhizobium hawassense TaxID=1209954 RepID=UPI00142D69DB|nr:hypothetical protein [Mesorhizobium hawassense]
MVAVEKTPPRPTTAMQRVRRMDGSAARGGKCCQREHFVIDPEMPLGSLSGGFENQISG